MSARRLSRTLLAVVFASLTIGVQSPAGAAPPGDNFADAQPIASVPATVTADLSGATRQAGEQISCGRLRRSVWYSFTPASETGLAFTLTSTTGSKAMAIYTGDDLGSLESIGCLTSTYWDIRKTFEAGKTVWIQVGSGFEGQMSATFDIKRTYSLSGRITDEEGNPLQSICVTDYSGSRSQQSSTDANGMYAIKTALAGTHRVNFSACTNGAYEAEYYDNQPTSSLATVVTISDADVSGIDAALARGSRIVGTVVDRRGGPPAWTCVYAYQGSDYAGAGYSTPSGSFFIALAPGTYTLQAGCNGYGLEWYDDAATQAEATTIEVTAGADTELANPIVLEPGGVIKGRLLKQSGAPLSTECVSIAQSADQTPVWGAYSNSQGYYEVRGLQSGEYRLRFGGCSFATAVSEWYSDATSFATATPVTVTYGQETVLGDAVLSVGTSISGSVSDEEGFPVPYACVGLYDASGNPIRTVTADAGGAYTAGQLADGDYRVRFGCASREFQGRWYPGTVTATETSPATGIDAVLDFRDPPDNDTFADAAVVSGVPFADERDLAVATMDVGERATCGSTTLRNSVWYALTPDQPAVVTASTIGTIDFDSVIATYVQTPAGLAQVDCVNDWAGHTVGEQMDIVALPGVTTYIQVSAAGTSPPAAGILKFSLS